MANYVSLENLQLYDGKIKAKIATDNAATLQSSKNYADSLASNYATAAQGATADANAKAIAELQTKNDTHLDGEANNKYNVKTNKIELYLNDGVETKEYKTITVSYEDPETMRILVYTDAETGNVIGKVNQDEQSISRDTLLNNSGVVDYYPVGTEFYIYDIGKGVYTEISDFNSVFSFPMYVNMYSFVAYAPTTTQSKVEVDMSELDEKMVSAIATKEDIENLFK